MENTSFFVEYLYKNNLEIAEIKTCCNEQDVWYYDVLVSNQYQFTITPTFDEKLGMEWKVSLKNSDKVIDSKVVDMIGQEIEKHLFLPR